MLQISVNANFTGTEGAGGAKWKPDPLKKVEHCVGFRSIIHPAQESQHEEAIDWWRCLTASPLVSEVEISESLEVAKSSLLQ